MTQTFSIGGLELSRGLGPVVLLGANGCGKTTLGHDLERPPTSAFRIAARRSITVPDEIRATLRRRVESDVARQKQNALGDRGYELSDMALVMELLLEEESERGLQLLRDIRGGRFEVRPEDADTNLRSTVRVWETLFPGRRLTFERREPRVTGVPRYLGPGDRRPTSYEQNKMSDGERQALYLVAKTMQAPRNSIVIVDEPEIHLHSALARNLWDLLEDLRPDATFVYLTHDIPFAISRRDGRLVIVRSKQELAILKSISDVPDGSLEEIVGGATFAVAGTRAVFCEGKSTSLDARLFGTWFRPLGIAVVPCDGCDDVLRTVTVLSTSQVLAGMSSIGIVDRDVRCDDEIAYLESKAVRVLEVGEVEHLLALPDVVGAVARHLVQDEDSTLELLRRELRLTFSQGLHRQALERAKDRIRWELNFPTSRITPGPDSESARENLVTSYKRCFEGIDPASAFDEALHALTEALEGDSEAMLRTFDGKGSIVAAAKSVGLAVDRYTDLVLSALADGRDGLGAELRSALHGWIPEPELLGGDAADGG